MTDETPGWAKAFEARVSSQLDGFETRLITWLDGLETRVGARLDGMATLEELAKVSAELDRMRTDLMARMDRLQEALTQQQEESFVNYASSTRGQERLQSLEEQINALTRMVMRFRTRLDDLEGKQRDH